MLGAATFSAVRLLTPGGSPVRPMKETGVPSPSSLQPILLDHARRYPLWKDQDLYKLLHQAAMGSEHAATDRDSARLCLEREITQLQPGPVEPLLDPIGAGGGIVRVHLRPWLDEGFDPEVLLASFLRTAHEWAGSSEELEDSLEYASSLARHEGLGLPREAVAAYAARMKALGYPAVHHSPPFEAEYRPAYRVVSTACLPDGLSPQ